jgi:hypothetical protein
MWIQPAGLSATLSALVSELVLSGVRSTCRTSRVSRERSVLAADVG